MTKAKQHTPFPACKAPPRHHRGFLHFCGNEGWLNMHRHAGTFITHAQGILMCQVTTYFTTPPSRTSSLDAIAVYRLKCARPAGLVAFSALSGVKHGALAPFSPKTTKHVGLSKKGELLDLVFGNGDTWILLTLCSASAVVGVVYLFSLGVYTCCT